MARSAGIPPYVLLVAFACGSPDTTESASDGSVTGGSVADASGGIEAGTSSTDESGRDSAIGTGSGSTTAGSSGSDSNAGWPDCPDVHEGDLMINDTTDVDAFALVGHVTGSVRVIGYSGTDLQFLSCLHRVDDYVWISQSPNLQNLTGLGNLDQLGGLLLRLNPGLTSLDGLGSVETLVSLVIWGNAALVSLDLSQLRHLNLLTIGTCDFNFEQGEDFDNPLLQDLDGLTALESLGGLTISSQSGIVSLGRLHDLAAEGGFENYPTIINNNPNLPYEQIELLEELAGELSSCGNLGEPAGNECYCENPG
jgi:hypothetical protein